MKGVETLELLWGICKKKGLIHNCGVKREKLLLLKVNCRRNKFMPRSNPVRFARTRRVQQAKGKSNYYKIYVLIFSIPISFIIVLLSVQDCLYCCTHTVCRIFKVYSLQKLHCLHLQSLKNQTLLSIHSLLVVISEPIIIHRQHLPRLAFGQLELVSLACLRGRLLVWCLFYFPLALVLLPLSSLFGVHCTLFLSLWS